MNRGIYSTWAMDFLRTPVSKIFKPSWKGCAGQLTIIYLRHSRHLRFTRLFVPDQNSMNSLQVNLDLVRKYNQPGPRYTSYPPATRFAAPFSREDLLERIEQNNQAEARDLSL